MNGSVSSKGEKRRSGFFGLGGKKDKEKVKEDKHEVSSCCVRLSLLVLCEPWRTMCDGALSRTL